MSAVHVTDAMDQVPCVLVRSVVLKNIYMVSPICWILHGHWRCFVLILGMSAAHNTTHLDFPGRTMDAQKL